MCSSDPGVIRAIETLMFDINCLERFLVKLPISFVFMASNFGVLNDLEKKGKKSTAMVGSCTCSLFPCTLEKDEDSFV